MIAQYKEMRSGAVKQENQAQTKATDMAMKLTLIYRTTMVKLVMV
jgi:hypothetical protein